MTTDHKPPMFDPATHKPCPDKSFWIADTDVTSLACTRIEAETIVGNCTTRILLRDRDVLRFCNWVDGIG